MANNDEYEIALIENETDARLCAQLIAEEFSSNNLMTIYDQQTPEFLFNKWLWPLVSDVMNQHLSFLARHRSTNEIVAAVIATDLYLFYKKHPYDPSGPPSDYAAIDLYEEMRHQFVTRDFGQELKPNMVVIISAGATRSNHSGKGIAGQLRTHVLNHARDTQGFQYAFVQTINPATRHIYVRKLNGEEKSIVDPATWIWKKGGGVLSPLKNYKGEPTVNVLIKLK